jgi:hypothetical protein
LYILCESFPAQHHDLQLMATACGYFEQTVDDFISVFCLAPATTAN